MLVIVTFVKVTKTRFFIQKSLAKKSTCLTALNRKVTNSPQCRLLRPWQKLHWAFATFPQVYE